jgi:hypothetical protein
MLDTSGDMITLKPLYNRQLLPVLTDESRPNWTILRHGEIGTLPLPVNQHEMRLAERSETAEYSALSILDGLLTNAKLLETMACTTAKRFLVRW